MDLESAKVYLLEIAERAESDGYDKVMIERDIPTMLGPGSLYFATQFFEKHMAGKRVAFVNGYEPIKAEMATAMLIANNHGGDFQVFDTSAAAEAWLLGS